MFSFGLAAGDKSTVLEAPNSFVLSPATSVKFFGDANPLDEVLTLDERGEFTVTGVLEQVNDSTDFPLTVIASYSTLESDPSELEMLDNWMRSIYRSHTYVLLKPDSDLVHVQEGIDALIDSYHSGRGGNVLYALTMQPLSNINLGTIMGNQLCTVLPAGVAYFLLGFALIILLTTCFNYVALTVSRALKRARELGVRKMFGTPPRTISVAMPDPYRGLSGSPSGGQFGSPSGDPIEGRSTESGSLFKGMSAESGRAYAQFVENAATKSENLSAFICESVLGCGGQIFLPDAYLKNAFAAVRNQGGVCITDEIQVGLGRLGSHFWGFQTHDVIPDIVTVGKPVGNGFPLGAVVTTREIADAFNNGMEYFNTFGGNPVSCAVGLAVLDVIEDEKLQENADKVGAHLLDGLKLLADKHPIIGDVRGQGLFLGIELVRDPETLEPAADEASYLVNRLCEERILTSTDGPLQNVIKIKPPLVFTVEDADHLLSQMGAILAEDFLQV